MHNPEFIRGFQWDLARQMERVDFLLRWIPKYAEWGYNQMYLYLEDAFDFPTIPGVGRKGALTPQQLATLTRTAERHGIKTVPVVPLLGHTAYLVKTPGLSRFAERRNESIDPSACGQICKIKFCDEKISNPLEHFSRKPVCIGAFFIHFLFLLAKKPPQSRCRYRPWDSDACCIIKHTNCNCLDYIYLPKKEVSGTNHFNTHTKPKDGGRTRLSRVTAHTASYPIIFMTKPSTCCHLPPPGFGWAWR